MAEALVAYFFEREDAAAVALKIEGAGVRRGRFHGEDDDEDHPWMVILPGEVDRGLLDELLDVHGGWLESPAAEPAPLPPPPLPTEPRRLKHR